MASTLTTNPAFDSRILRLGQVTGSNSTSKFQRGYLMTAQRRNPSLAGQKQRRFRVNFLYNPSDLSVSHSVDLSNNATALPPELQSDADIGQVRGLTGSSVSFSLLFDRTYECANTGKWNEPASAMGCYVDVLTIYGLCGIAQPTFAAAGVRVPNAPGVGTGSDNPLGSAAASGTATNSANAQVYGVMKLNPVFAVFCPVRVVDQSGLKTGVSMMRYYGYISSLTVSYTHWTQRMIPVRCVVSVGMTLLMTDNNLLEP